MKLFHLSDVAHQQLQPQMGKKRHGGEDPRAVGVPVVWLANDPAMRAQGPSGEVLQYQHEVDVADDDPDLFIDQPFATLTEESDKVFGTKTTLRWYFLKRAIDVVVVRRWDAARNGYL